MAENGIKLAVDALTHCYRLFPEVGWIARATIFIDAFRHRDLDCALLKHCPPPRPPAPANIPGDRLCGDASRTAGSLNHAET